MVRGIMKKLFILGLDCATPQLIFDKYINELPVFKRLLEKGKYGLLESTIPPLTVPAWMSMMTGKDPGQLGFYGFTDREDNSYTINKIVTHNDVKANTLWDYAGESGLHSIVFNLPQTYPPRKINGIMVASFLTPDKKLSYTYPEKISQEIEEIADGEYIIDVENFRTNDKKKLLGQIYEMTEKRFKVLKNYIKSKKWHLFIAVEMGTDRVHHGFWSYCFEDHRLYKENNEFKNAIFEYYKYIDKKLEELIETFDDDTELIIVSDHGAKNLKGTFCLNDWLIENGYLFLKNKPLERSSFDVDNVDWSRSIAWGSGGYYGKIYFNVENREDSGIIPEDKIDSIKNELIEKLSLVRSPDGDLISNKVFDVNHLYRELKGFPPDLFVLVGELDWRVTNSVGNASLFIYEDTRIDNANHDLNGIFIHSTRPKFALNKKPNPDFEIESLSKYSIIDIAPTVLSRFGIDIPKGMFGKIIN
jgi:predicted AlkP superfamily phosphohydrolase/phosphomutase